MPEPGITIVRVFDAPRERVWREWTEPAAFADWFGGGDCVIPLSTVSMDVRAGGSWRATMFCDGGSRRIDGSGEYLEVVEPERIVLTFSADPGVSNEVVTVVLHDVGEGRTEMHFEQRGSQSPEDYQRAGAGWRMFLDRLASRL
jgi:uncharacterized protein YndB with AHSA1/START domain